MDKVVTFDGQNGHLGVQTIGTAFWFVENKVFDFAKHIGVLTKQNGCSTMYYKGGWLYGVFYSID